MPDPSWLLRPPFLPTTTQHGRRRALRGLAGVGLATTGVAGLLRAQPAAADSTQALLAESIYFPETQHSVGGPFWQFWRQHGLEAFGYPVSEPFEDGGVLNQYFQRARFELAPDGRVRLGMLGVEAGGTASPHATPETAPDIVVAPETGHSVTGAFLPVYRQMRAITGPPIGPEQAVDAGVYVQYFANARLEWDPFGGARLGLLGSELAAQRGVHTGPVPQHADAVSWGDYLAAWEQDTADRRAFAARVTGGVPFVPAFGQRWVFVSIRQQRVYAYEDRRQAFTDLISSGVAYKGLSSTGVFAINRRVANETMDSRTIGYPPGHPKHYRLENVLHTQYYNGGEALHYAWWHSNFGQPMSYGCINMRLATAKWFWDWATLGTPVVVA